jgi:hypothetical protein
VQGVLVVPGERVVSVLNSKAQRLTMFLAR